VGVISSDVECPLVILWGTPTGDRHIYIPEMALLRKLTHLYSRTISRTKLTMWLWSTEMARLVPCIWNRTTFRKLVLK